VSAQSREVDQEGLAGRESFTDQKAIVPRLACSLIFEGHCQAVRGVRTKARGSRSVGTSRASAHTGNHHYGRKTVK
jgi:hypothetical protein